MANRFTFWHDYNGGWFFESYWNPWTAYAQNMSSESSMLSGVVFTFVSGNSGGQSFHVGGSNYNIANGSGCKMKCVASYGNTSVESAVVQIPPTTESNIAGNILDNTQCYFTPRPGPEHTFYFNNPLQVPSGGKVTLQFYVTQWTGGGSSTGYPCIQVSSSDIISEPTSFLVEFDLNGGKRTGGGALSQTVLNGKDAIPPTCEKSGFKFIEWDKSYKNISANTTIAAVWQALPIWRYDGTKWVKYLQAHVYKDGIWQDANTYEFDNNWKTIQ